MPSGSFKLRDIASLLLQINVFMTHMSNYGNDRLALYTFETAIKFVQCWTNLQLMTYPPVTLAEKYFKMHPDEIDPIWGVSGNNYFSCEFIFPFRTDSFFPEPL